MKVIGFNKLTKKNRKKRCFVICFHNVFRNCMIVMGVLLFMLVLNLISKNFLNDTMVSLEKFAEYFVKVV